MPLLFRTHNLSNKQLERAAAVPNEFVAWLETQESQIVTAKLALAFNAGDPLTSATAHAVLAGKLETYAHIKDFLTHSKESD
jgi:hypothetical protein